MRNLFKSLVGAGCLLLAVQSVEATPISYQFSGTKVGEYSTANGPVFSNIFGSISNVSGGFSYDANAPMVGYSPVSGYGPGVQFTTYSGAFLDFDLEVDAYSATSDKGVGLVGNDAHIGGGPFVQDVLIGYTAPDPQSGFSSFQVGDWNLSGIALVFFYPPVTFDQDKLLASLSGGNSLMELFFTSTSGQIQKVRYSLNVEQTVSVPEPSTLVLLSVGIFGLLLRGHKRKA